MFCIHYNPFIVSCYVNVYVLEISFWGDCCYVL